jgi:PAS domain S-box-containing protein
MQDPPMIQRRSLQPSLHKLLADSVALGIFLCDPAGRVSGWTRSASNLTGVSEADIVGREVQVLFRPASATERGMWQAALRGSAANYRDIGFALRADGSEFLAVFTMDRVSGEAGNVIGYACTLGAL